MELFWSMTPKEFHFVFDAWEESRNYMIETSWEQTRLLLYYQYCGIPKKNKNPSFQRFKAEHLPFTWDKINKETIDAEYEQPISPNEWLDRISKMRPAGGVSKPEEIR